LKPQALLDENVSLEVRPILESIGYDVQAIALLKRRAMSDPDVFALAIKENALLVTRDRDFTNSIRFPPSQLRGILFLMDGNLSGADEAQLIKRFLTAHSPDTFRGKLVSLSPHTTRIR
jgi:predicted nuclease of predicted toxin-antitoxin system